MSSSLTRPLPPLSFAPLHLPTQLHSLADGSLLQRIGLPVGTLSGISRHHDDSELFLSFTSFLTPGTIYRMDVAKDNEVCVCVYV